MRSRRIFPEVSVVTASAGHAGRRRGGGRSRSARPAIATGYARPGSQPGHDARPPAGRSGSSPRHRIEPRLSKIRRTVVPVAQECARCACVCGGGRYAGCSARSAMADEAAPALREACAREVQVCLRQGAWVACWLAITLRPGLRASTRSSSLTSCAAAGPPCELRRRDRDHPLAPRARPGPPPDLLTFALACVIVFMIRRDDRADGRHREPLWPGLARLLAPSVLMACGRGLADRRHGRHRGRLHRRRAARGTAPVADLTNNLSFSSRSGIIAAADGWCASRLQWLAFPQRAALEEAVRTRAPSWRRCRTSLHRAARDHRVAPTCCVRGGGRRGVAASCSIASAAGGLFLNRMLDLLDFAKVERARPHPSRSDRRRRRRRAGGRDARPLGTARASALAVTGGPPAGDRTDAPRGADRPQPAANAIKFTERWQHRGGGR